MSRKMALLPTVALLGALVACQPASQGRCVEWGVRYQKIQVLRGKTWHPATKAVPVCTRYETKGT